MRKFLVLALIPMFFTAMACQKSEETAPESAASVEASPAVEAAPSGAKEASPAPMASPAAP